MVRTSEDRWRVHVHFSTLLISVLLIASVRRVTDQRRTEIRLAYSPPGDIAALHRQANVEAADIERGVQVHNMFKGLPNLQSALALPLLAGAALEADPVYWHLKHIICAGDADAALYVCRWLAYVLQMRAKSEIVLVLTGGHGAGKTMFVGKLAEMFGQYYYPMQNAQDILVSGEDFEQALLVFCDELRKCSENLYSRYKTASAIFPSFSNWIFSTNESELSNLLPIDLGERRFVVLRVSDQLLAQSQEQKVAYFSRLKTASVGPLMHYLLQHPVLHRGETYITQATFESKVGALDIFEKWWYM
jgi:hypothetical protein